MKQVQHPRGNTAQNMAWTFPESVLSYDTTLKQYRMHDGITPGGWLLQRQADVPSLFGGVNPQPAVIPLTAALVKNANDLNLAGNWQLPVLATMQVGVPFYLRATVVGVNIIPQGGDTIEDQGNVGLTTLALTQYAVYGLAKWTATAYRVISKY